MFIHQFKYSLKTLFRNKSLIFWTFAFPLILATFFYMAFSNITESEKLDIIKIAIINDQEFRENQEFKAAFKKLGGQDNKNRLFKVFYTTEKKAKELLAGDQVIGYLKLINKEPKLTFNNNGIDQTIFKYVVEEISQTSKMIRSLSFNEVQKQIKSGNFQIDDQAIYAKVMKMVDEHEVKLKNISNRHLDYVMIEFYTLIAMACMYGGILGMVAINQNLANMSNKGKRISIAPIKKSVILASNLLASYFAQLFGLALLFSYTIFVLNVDYGNHIGLVILLALLGSFAGLSMGVGIGTWLKSNEQTKIGVLIAITMFGCFLSGMFGITMKYLVDQNIPILNQFNPVNMITDGLYSLYYYDTLNRYWFNIFSLLFFSLILILFSFLRLRRQKYDSI